MQVHKNQGYNQGNPNYKGRKCKYCHYTGHIKENCYKLIGYPTDWKQRKKHGYGTGNLRGSYRGYNNQGYGGYGYENPSGFGAQTHNNGQ